MFLQFILEMMAGMIFIMQETLAQDPKPVANKEYLGSPASKAYYFPWLVTIHRESGGTREFFGSGTILTDTWVIGSMDSFVRNSIGGYRRPFYQEIELLNVYSGGIWGQPYLQELDGAPVWYQKRRISEIRMFSDPDHDIAHLELFRQYSEPRLLNEFRRSPFGFSMAICLFKIRNAHGQALQRWLWKRSTLPIPLMDVRPHPIKFRLQDVIEGLEKAPYSVECYVGGWRLDDQRLVQHKVVYVPFEQCEAVFCGYDQRSCLEWPVNGTHVCFKSLSFDELCWLDQGSALYCEAIYQSAIAILTSAPTCGYGGLPGVYTLIYHALNLYERVSPTVPYHPINKVEALKYTPPPEKYLIPAYG